MKTENEKLNEIMVKIHFLTAEEQIKVLEFMVSQFGECKETA